MSWVGCLLKDSELFILLAENGQIFLKISVIPILLTFMYLVALNLLVNKQLNSLSNSTHHCGTKLSQMLYLYPDILFVLGERWQWVKLPMEWTNSGTHYTSMGAIGYVKSGGAVFDHRSSPFGDLASCHEWISLDPSHGHSDPSKQYHYHGVRIYLRTIHILCPY